jgi:hypothetical protein
MKSTSLLLLCSLFAVTTQAQFDPINYFTDSISIAFDVCYVRKEKKKEITVCVPRHYQAELTPVTLTIHETIEQSKRNTGGSDMHQKHVGQIANIDFNESKITKYWDFDVNATTTPAGIYELRLYPATGKPQFTTENKLMGKTNQLSITLYFKSHSDAYSANEYLKSLQ